MPFIKSQEMSACDSNSESVSERFARKVFESGGSIGDETCDIDPCLSNLKTDQHNDRIVKRAVQTLYKIAHCSESNNSHSLQCKQSTDDYEGSTVDRLFHTLPTELSTQPPNIGERPGYYIWPSSCIIDPILGDDTSCWSPETWSANAYSSTETWARYHILPFFASQHWQLAIFDIVNHEILRYDSHWPDGTDRFTFSVSLYSLRLASDLMCITDASALA